MMIFGLTTLLFMSALDPEQRDRLFDSIKKGEGARVAQLVQENPALARARTDEGVSAILLALYYGKKEIARALSQAVSELDIFESAALGEIERVRTLLKQTPELANAYSSDGFTPLGYAAFFSQPGTAEVLVAAGARPNVPSRNAMRVMPLHSAAAAQQIGIARLLIDHGADVNASQQAGFTPLHEAARAGQVDLARLLLDNGADVNARAEKGETALALAVASGQTMVAAYLRERGAR